ncbi:hypothetical protein TNCV_842911 [Trichonephila clavipes]|nr:hypothetical protein TNCV_842911 [Trichonephila clavipes]
MVDIDILIQIWKNRVKKIDFVLKWLSRVGSEVGSTKVLYEGDPRSRWRNGQVCPDVDKELWRLGPDGSGEKGQEEKELGNDKYLVVLGSGEENPRVLLGDADQES